MFYLATFPPKAAPPNHAFGKLPALKFPAQASPSGQLTYKLETIQGDVPRASESALVYFMPKKTANLLALTQTQSFAQRLQFNPTPIQESKNIYLFNDTELALRKLKYDLVTDNFILRYGFEQDVGLFADKNLPFTDVAQSEAIGMLQSYNRYPDDFSGGKINAIFLRLMGAQLIPASSLTQADAIRVDFFRKPIGNTPIVTPNPDQGSIYFIFSGSEVSKKRLLQFNYTYWPIDYQTTATYGLKTSVQAWQELQNGQGYIARYPTNGTNAVIRNVYLAYYDSYDPQTYLQPIFVFEGDNGFLGFVSAIAPPWIE